MNGHARLFRRFSAAWAWVAALGWGLGLAGTLHGDCDFESIRPAANGMVLKWRGFPGFVYRVSSAVTPAGPWNARSEVTLAANAGEWTDAAVAEAATRFYRIEALTPNGCAAELTLDSATRDALGVADAAPREAMLWYQTSRQVAAEAVYLASQLGAGGLQLVTTGTLTQQPQFWNYEASPSDRLVVKFSDGTTTEFTITVMQGDFSGDASTFLSNNHNFSWRAVSAAVGDFTCTSQRSGRLIASTAKGTLLWKTVPHAIDLTAQTDHFFESSGGGSQTITDTQIGGKISGPGWELTVNQRLRFELVAHQGVSSSTNEEWLGHELRFGTDTYRWVDVKKQKSFRDGKPSEVPDYWQARGALLKNGVPIGEYRKVYRDLVALQQVKFILQFANDSLELESWDIR